MAPVASITRRPRGASTVREGGVEAKLIAATGRLLSGGTPFIELSVEQLCSEAGVARSSFYMHFRDKADLVIRLTESLLEEIAAAARTWWEPGASRAEAAAATRRLVGTYAEHGELFAALTETAAYDAGLRAVQQAMVDRQATPLAELIEAGKSGGGVREIPTAETVTALAWMVQGACFRMARGADGPALDRLAEALTSIIWHSLYPDAAAAPAAGGR
jgi:AcrR family transcriptional regulator